MTLLPTGEQYELRRGADRAVITELAASLRTLEIDGVSIVPDYPADRLPPTGAGIVLVPWPNRVRDGRWTLDGATQQLDITEPSRGNASHGLLRNTGYRLVERDESSVTLAAPIFPQHGYPFTLETAVSYTLVDGGLRVSHRVTNHSAEAAPVAIGTHPFFHIGGVPTAELALTVNASTCFEVDDRMLPVGATPVEGSDVDFRAGRVLGGTALDVAFGQLEPGVSASIAAPDGRTVSVWQDESFGYVQVFTNAAFPMTEEGAGLALAIEPMTAPADALNSGAGLRWLEPGETWNAGWGVLYSG